MKKFTGIDQLIDMVLSKLGNVELALVTGDYASRRRFRDYRRGYSGRCRPPLPGALVGMAEKYTPSKFEVRSEADELERLSGTLNLKESVVVWGVMDRRERPGVISDHAAQSGCLTHAPAKAFRVIRRPSGATITLSLLKTGGEHRYIKSAENLMSERDGRFVWPRRALSIRKEGVTSESTRRCIRATSSGDASFPTDR